MRRITKLMLTLMLLIVCIGANAEKKYLTFSCADYCAAQWNSETNTLTWGTGGWDAAWTFMAADGISGDLSEWESLHLNAKDFVNSQENKLTVVFKKNDGSNPPSGPTKEFVVSPDANGDITIDLKNVTWGDCDITNIQDLTIYGGARVDDNQSGSVVVTDAYFEKADSQPQPQPEVNEEVVDFDASFYHNWSDVSVTATDNGVVQGGGVKIGEEVEIGGTIWGNLTGAVPYLDYANITDYKELRFEGTPGGTIRLMCNRLTDEGPIYEIKPTIGDDGKLTVKISDLKYLNGGTPCDYVFLQSIKVPASWAGGTMAVTINSIKIVKDAEATVDPQPAEPTEVTFDFDASEHAASSNTSHDGDITVDEVLVQDGVTITITPSNASTANRYWGSSPKMRMYGGTMTIAAPEDKAITKVIFKIKDKWGAGNTLNGAATEVADAAIEWTGNSTNVVLAVSANTQIKSVEVTLAAKTAETTTYAPKTIANTAETAYTVAEAIALIDAGEALNDVVFVKGFVSQVDSINSGAIYYWISDDGTTANQFECYKGKGIDGADFTSVNDIEVGAEVTVTGVLTKYNEIYEFKGGNKLVSYKAPFHAPFADGKYYIYNVGAQKYLAAGANWGTHAVVNADGLDYIITATDGKYTLDSQISNGGNSHFLNGEWNDGAALGWIFAAVEGKEGVYTISNGTQFLTAQDNGEVTLAADATAAAAQWTLKTLEARIAELATATAEAPVNATFLIQDANFGRNDLRKSAWTMEASNQNLSGGNNTNNNAESYHSVFTLSQVLTNVPKGVYTLTAQGFYRQDGEDNENLPVFFANDYTQTFPLKTGSENSMSDASASFSAGNYTIDPIYFQLTEAGDLTVGAKLENNANLWCIWDNFQLTYYGVDADLEAVKNAAIIKELADLRAKAEALKAEVEVDAVKTAIDEALGATAEVSGADAINTAITTMKAVIEKADVHIAAKAALDGMANVMAGTNVYTAEAFETYNGIYETAKGKYQAGELTKDDVIENPEAQMGWHTANTVDDLLLSVWTIGETQCKDYDAGMYINTWSVEGNNDGSNFKVPFFEYWTGDGESLGENKLTATMSNLEPGTYDVTAWVRVRAKNGYTAPAYGISLQANDGEAVDVAAGDQIGESQFYLKEFTARGTVAEDGVLKIQFNVAADNNISWLSFKNVKFEKYVVEVAHTWDFTKWSDATVANLKAEAAKGYTEGLWSDSEKADGSASTMEISKDNCFWQVGTSAAEGETLTANGEEIAELKGLIFKNNKARSLAIAVNYGDCTSANGDGFGPYHGASYLWLGSKNIEYFTIKNVKAGTQIKMGVESHKLTDARGVQLLIGETVLTDPEGAAVAAPTTYTEQTWAVPGEEGVVDVVVKNTNGCHIYFIDAEIGEADPYVPEEDPDLVEIPQDQGKTLDDFVRTELVEGDDYNTYTCTEGIQVAFKMFDIDVKDCDYVVVKFAEPVAAGWELAFWGKNDQSTVAVPEGATEFKYVFAEDAKCAIVDDVLPQICMLHLWTGTTPLVAKVKGVYKHKVSGTDAINTINTAIQNGNVYNLNGQKVQKAQRGLYIINGKKVVIK